ncbi:MAG: hypothetical protein EZS28_045372, partial [Streblomastix strix]
SKSKIWTFIQRLKKKIQEQQLLKDIPKKKWKKMKKEKQKEEQKEKKSNENDKPKESEFENNNGKIPHDCSKEEVIMKVEQLNKTDWDEWIQGRSFFSFEQEGDQFDYWFSQGLQQIFIDSLIEADEIQLKTASTKKLKNIQIRTICPAIIHRQIQKSDWLKELHDREGGNISRFGEQLGDAFEVTMYNVRRINREIFGDEEQKEKEQINEEKQGKQGKWKDQEKNKGKLHEQQIQEKMKQQDKQSDDNSQEETKDDSSLFIMEKKKRKRDDNEMDSDYSSNEKDEESGNNQSSQNRKRRNVNEYS